MIYRFKVNDREVFPIYKTDLSKDFELESNQRFYRAKLSGKLSFIGSDFDWFDSQAFETLFEIEIESSIDRGATWQHYFTGKFQKTDCDWDDDNKKMTVKPDAYDEYNDVLAGIEKEFNLIKLSPAKTPVQIQKRPLIQLYVPGDSVVSCFLSGNYWEQDTAFEVTDTSSLVNDYYFALASTMYKVNVTGAGTPTKCTGDYVSESQYSLTGKNLTDAVDDVYRFTYNTYPEEDGYGNPTGNTLVDAQITRINDSELMFEVVGQVFNGEDITLTAVSSEATGTLDAYIFSPIKVYMRYLLDVDTISGLNTYDIPSDDIVENNRNYHRVIGYAIDQVSITANASSAPTEYGIMDDGTYFDEPAGFPSYYKYIPVARSTWGLSSMWFNFDLFDWILEEQGRKSYTMKDSVLISDAIKVLLAEIAPDITHDGTSEYSQFLYGTNPLTGTTDKLMITQKSNILAGEYDRPAQKAPITLQMITGMLRDVYRCFWYIDNGKFKIEHIKWFRNGGTYSGTPNVGIDLTTLQNPRNNKKWGFQTSNYKFDKVNMAQYYQFGWMDEVTYAFTGFDIEILSSFIEKGKIEEVNVSNFTTDVDFMLLNPGEMSMDGFALMSAVVPQEQTIYEPDEEDKVINATKISSWTGVGFWEQMTEEIMFNRVELPIYRTGTEINAVLKIAVFNSLPTPGNFPTVYEPSVIFTKSLSDSDISATPLKSSKIELGSEINIGANKYVVFLLSYANGTVLHYRFTSQNTGGTRHNYLFSNIADSFNSTWLNTSGTTYLQVGFELYYQSTILELPFVTRTIDNAELRMQNGRLSWIYLHPNFYVYDLPSTNVKINNSTGYVYGIERNKKQDVNVPTGESDPDPMELVKTYLGNGQVEKISVNLHSRQAKITLKYDTE